MHFLFRVADDILSFEEDPAVDHLAGRIHQTQDGKSGHGLTAAGFSHKSQHFSTVDGEADAIHCFNDAQFCKKIGFDVFYN
jgi:hypothetical protein